MTDIYVKSQDQNALQTFLSNFVNSLPVQPGRAATTDSNGNPVAAIGDTTYWYSCVRIQGDGTITVDGNIIKTEDPTEGAAIVGVFA